MSKRLWWLLAFLPVIGFECWAVLWGGYEWTLTATVRSLVDENLWLGGIVAAFCAWLGYHFLIERRKRK